MGIALETAHSAELSMILAKEVAVAAKKIVKNWSQKCYPPNLQVVSCSAPSPLIAKGILFAEELNGSAT